MLAKLEKLVDEIGVLHSKLILLVGLPRSGKTALLRALGERSQTNPLNLGSELGHRLAAIPQRQRHLEVVTILRELADRHAKDNLLLVDNLELLFDATLQLNPLDLLKRQATSRRVVAVWPGALIGDGNAARLTYAEMGHQEYRSDGLDGLVPFKIPQ